MQTNKSVIQSTMVKITLLIFAILIILYFFIAKIYWDKEVLERKFHLQSVAYSLQIQIEANREILDNIKQNNDCNLIEKKCRLDSLLKKSFEIVSKNNPDMMIGYYDRELNSMFTYTGHEEKGGAYFIDHHQITQLLAQSENLEFISDTESIDWDGKGIIAVTVPVLGENEITGHTWAMLKADNIFYNSYVNYSKVFVPSVILWIFIVALIKRSKVRIQSALDGFAQMIVKDDLDSSAELEIPELKPVYDKIRTYLHNLELLNKYLEESNDKLLTIMEGISDGFFSLDKEWRFTYVNEETKRLTRTTTNDQDIDVIGRDFRETVKIKESPVSAENFTSVMNQQIPMMWEEYWPQVDKHLKIHAYPLAQGITIFFRDITLDKQREREMVRLERLNLIGQMAAGISHEVRNPLTIVKGFLQMLESRADCEQNREYMEIMISEINRANEIISDFLSLAKANSDCIKLENINEIIYKIHPMLQADAFNSNKDVIIETNDVPDLKLNESEMRQLILNLVRNGLEETPEEGKVYISTYQEDNNVILAIRDQGKGIPLEVQEKMGTPFITTKESGTGLGLAISIGIVKRHNARLEFKTGSEGTTFYIIFPLDP